MPGKTYIIVSANSGLALTHEGRSTVTAADGTTSSVQGYFGTDIVTENDIITKTFVAANKIESPIQDHLRFWFKPLTHPNPGQYTAENGYVGFGLQSLVHGGLIEPFFIHRNSTTDYPNTLAMFSNNHITHEDLDRGVWFNTPIDPVTGETTLFLYSPGETPYYYGLAGNRNGFVAERIMDINNPGDLFKVKTYEYVYVDKQPPVMTIPADITVQAESVLTAVDIGEATATDYSDFTITNNAPANGMFPGGVTEIVWTATDIHGNSVEAIQKVTVQYTFGGVTAPFGQNNTFNSGSALPIKFSLKALDGNFMKNATAKLFYAPVVSGTPGVFLPAISIGNANIGNDFRFSEKDNQYLFNMDTKDLESGDYKLKIVLDDLQEFQMDITLTAKGSKK